MKRKGNLLSEIVAYENLRLAWLKALRGKRKSSAALLFSRDVDRNLSHIKRRLESTNPGWGDYRSFTISDPKPRVISAASFPERVMHHALMNVLEPLFERGLVHHCYACRKGKGTHAAVLQAFHWCKSGGWFLKLDVRKYFDSIDHAVLKSRLSRIIKDRMVLNHLCLLIDSYCTVAGKGVPIGNLTSQFFANLYLSALDHYVLEKQKPGGYLRYMDDFVVWTTDKGETIRSLNAIGTFCTEHLKLSLKAPVMGRVSMGLPFLGFSITPTGIFLMQKSKRRMEKRARTIEHELLQGRIDEAKAAERAVSVNAAVLLARCRSFRIQLWHGSGFGHEPRQTRRQLEQQCVELHCRQPEQQQPEQPEQQ